MGHHAQGSGGDDVEDECGESRTTKVFVGGLPLDAAEEDMKRMLTEASKDDGTVLLPPFAQRGTTIFSFSVVATMLVWWSQVGRIENSKCF